MRQDLQLQAILVALIVGASPSAAHHDEIPCPASAPMGRFEVIEQRSIRDAQVRISDQGRPSRSRAFARTISLRMMATRATFAGFPAAIS